VAYRLRFPAALAARGETLASHPDGRGASLARRDDREYREYLREEQRRQRGCIARRMQPGFHHGLLAGLLLMMSCGGDDNGSPSSPTPPPNPNSITISTSGVVTPRELAVAPGSRVLFLNSHSRRHDVTSDPHPDHQDCPELNQVGLLATGQSRESGNLNTVRRCGFHDHEDPDNANLRGTIIIR
jgi:hypothetical protein